MKQFLFTNWYRLMIATSFFVFSVGFLVFALKGNPAHAGTSPMWQGSFQSPSTETPQFINNGGAVYIGEWRRELKKYVFTYVGKLPTPLIP